MVPQDRFIQVGTIKTRYWLVGSGSPVVLIHGLGGYVENWLPCLDVLAERHTVAALDLVGFGHTEKPRDACYSIDGLARFVADFMDGIGLQRAAVVGYSMGGGVALRFALHCPERVERLALISSVGLGREGALVMRIMWLPLIGEWLCRPSLEHSRRGAEGMAYICRFTGDLVVRDYEMTAQPGAVWASLKTLRSMGSMFGQNKSLYQPHLRALPGFPFPVMVIWGRQDPIVPVAHAGVVARCLPTARVHILDRCGHIPMFEQTEACSGLLADFLQA